MPKPLSLKVNARNVTQVFAGAAALTLVSGGGLIFWLHGRIAAQEATQANLQAQVGSSEKVAKRLQATQAEYNLALGKIAVLETSVTQNSYVPTLLQQIQQLAGDTNLTVNSLHPGDITAPPAPAAKTQTAAVSGSGAASGSAAPAKKAAPPPYQTMGIDLGVSGTYADTARFLYGLTRFPKILSVVSVQMTPGPSAPSGAPAPVTTMLKLTAYIFPDNPAPAAGAAPTAQAAAFVTPTAAPTLAGAAGRAAQGAVAATRAADSRATDAAHVL